MKPQTWLFYILAFAAICSSALMAQNYTFQSVECNGVSMSGYGINGAGVVAGSTVDGGAIYYNGTCYSDSSTAIFWGVSDTDWLIATVPFVSTYYLIEPGPKVLPLPNYPGAQATEYCCVSPATGTLAGNYVPGNAAIDTRVGFFYQDGKFTSLPWSEASGSNSYWYQIAALNNTGIAVGTYQSSYMLGFTLVKGKIMLLEYPGAKYTYFYGVNDSGLVVGTYFLPNNSSNVFTYNINTGAWTNLNFPAPYDLLIPAGISNAGVIALVGPDNGGLILATPVSGN